MQKSKPNMKILIFGAGVLGSLYGAKLAEAGMDVALVARGKRLEDIQKNGIILEKFEDGTQTRTEVKVLDHMPRDAFFDLCVVLVRKEQLDDALDQLKKNTRIPSFLFMVNTAESPQALIDALGKDRILLGHANAGGERDGSVIRYMVAENMPLGELDGKKSARIQQIANAFRQAGFPVSISKNMDAWKRYHVALVGPLANALYMASGCNYRLASSKGAVRKGIMAMREAFSVLSAHKIPVHPRSLLLFKILPNWILVPLFQKVFAKEIMDIGGARHALAARDEMAQLNQELFALAKKAKIDTPHMSALHRYADPSVKPALPCPRHT